MGIFEGMVSGFLQSISFHVLPYLFVGSIFGLVIGVIPGLSGHFAMAMAVTFLYSLEPAAGIAFILGAHATVAQGGGLTAILFSTPGTGQNAATLLDGPPMRDKGQAGIAVGAAMTSCFLGATFGAIALALLIPVLRDVVLLFGPPEIFILAFLALTFVSVLGKEDMTRSLIAAFLGLLMAMIGVDNVTNAERFTLGSARLADGLSLVPVILGLFAVAEMIDLWTRGGSLARNAPDALSSAETQRQIFGGLRVAFRNWWLVLRCSAIGTVVGLIPGLGSAPAAFIAYGHAKQSSRDKESFGKGNVEGVIGAEAANDAVEGGALASTIAFGIPGSSSMAILLSGLFILGLETGPQMLNNHVDIIFVMIFTIIFGNLIGTVFGMFLVNPLSRATSVRASLMVPVLMAIIVTGAYAGDRAIFDIGVALFFGVIGYLMKVLNYSRAAMLIGFVLGFPVEKNLYLALLLDGSFFFAEPLPLGLMIVTILFLGFNVVSVYRHRKRSIITEAQPKPKDATTAARLSDLLSLEICFLTVIGVTVVAAFFEALTYQLVSSRTPFVIMAPLFVLTIIHARRLFAMRDRSDFTRRVGIALRGENRSLNKVLAMSGWMVALVGMITVIGHYAGIIIFGFLLTRVLARERLILAVVVTLATAALIFVIFEYGFNIELYRGLLFRYFAGYRDF